MTHEITAEVGIVVTKTLTLILGGLITYYAYKAYSRTGSPALRALAIGFGVITVGLVVAGAGNLLLHVPTLYSVFLESVLTTIGLAVIVYSLYAR